MEIVYNGEKNKLRMSNVVKKYLYTKKIFIISDEDLINIDDEEWIASSYIKKVYEEKKKESFTFWYSYLKKLVIKKYKNGGFELIGWENDLENEDFEYFRAKLIRWANKNSIVLK